jgi:hypothetical protein
LIHTERTFSIISWEREAICGPILSGSVGTTSQTFHHPFAGSVLFSPAAPEVTATNSKNFERLENSVAFIAFHHKQAIFRGFAPVGKSALQTAVAR